MVNSYSNVSLVSFACACYFQVLVVVSEHVWSSETKVVKCFKYVFPVPFTFDLLYTGV